LDGLLGVLVQFFRAKGDQVLGPDTKTGGLGDGVYGINSRPGDQADNGHHDQPHNNFYQGKRSGGI
jgi:hypothetical protein